MAQFQDELEEQRITAESIIKKSRDYLSELQTIGSKIFGRWVKSLNPS